MEAQVQNDGEYDFVPEHLVSPFPVQTKFKAKGHFQRVYNEDLVDMGVMPPGKHPPLVSRRQSDPGGRASPAAAAMTASRHRGFGGSCSSSDDEEYERSPRSYSPRHFVGPVPEEDGSLLEHGRMSPGLSSSPRRRLMHQRYSTALPITALMGDESPRIRPKAFRSNSLPLQFMPFEVGEAVGALAKVPAAGDLIKRTKAVDSSKSSSVIGGGVQISAAKRAHGIGRWISTEEPLLESIVEENGAKVCKPRRLSMPHCFSADKYTEALP